MLYSQRRVGILLVLHWDVLISQIPRHTTEEPTKGQILSLLFLFISSNMYRYQNRTGWQIGSFNPPCPPKIQFLLKWAVSKVFVL